MIGKRRKKRQKSPLVFLGVYCLYVSCMDSYHTRLNQEFREGQPVTMDFRNTGG